MSCENCNNCQDGNYEESANGSVVRIKSTGAAYYRWKNANIEMNGCDEHLKEIFDVLNTCQDFMRIADENDKKNEGR